MQQPIPASANKLIQDKQGNLSTFPFPDNIAALLPKRLRTRILQWMLTNYIWPQVQDRQTYEKKWDKLHRMATVALKLSDLKMDEKSRLAKRARDAALQGQLDPQGRADLSDTVVYDAIDRTTNLNHFISFKEKIPVQYNIPEDVIYSQDNEVYSPISRIIKSGNALLKYCAAGTNFYREHWITARHHYTYGISFASCEYVQKIEPKLRRIGSTPQFGEVLELTKFGVNFQPISLRKLWLNSLLKPYDMEYQGCPFFYEEMPRFAIIANPYDKQLNPSGFVNLDELPNPQYLQGTPEMQSFLEAIKQQHPEANIPNTADPDKQPELKWTLYPMLPLQKVPAQQVDPQLVKEFASYFDLNNPKEAAALQQLQTEGAIYIFDYDGKLALPVKRYICDMFGGSLTAGQVDFIKIQENFYPNDGLPLFGSAHMPSLDAGMYSPAIGDILENHFVQITKALNQYMDNKDLINDPPHQVQSNSPSIDSDLNRPGANNMVNSLNDYKQHEIIDGTQTTPAFLQAVRDQAQTSSKAVDAILGKAMGSRTTASEASNVYEAAMAGVTTDINLFNYDIAGGYAQRVWDYIGSWTDPDLIQAITGQFGFALKPEHMAIRLSIDWDVGSTYIEKMNRQQNLQYILQSSVGDPSINRPYLWRALLREWRFKDINQIVNDGGMEHEILQACQQAEDTYLGSQLVLVDPEQNHHIAKRVKTSYLKDRDSVWNTDPRFATNANALVQQVMIHEQFIMLQYYQQLAQAQAGAISEEGAPPSPGPSPSVPPAIGMPGMAASMAGGQI